MPVLESGMGRYRVKGEFSEVQTIWQKEGMKLGTEKKPASLEGGPI